MRVLARAFLQGTVVISGLSILATALPVQAAGCTWPRTISMSGVTGDGSPYLTRITFSEKDEDLVSIVETDVVNLSKAQSQFASKVVASPGWHDLQTKQNCNHRFNSYSFNLRPQEPNAVGEVGLNAEDWTCMSTTVPCPNWNSWGGVTKTCQQGIVTKIAGAHVSQVMIISTKGDSVANLQAYVSNSSTSASTSPEQRFFIDAVGLSLGGVGGAFVSDVLQQQVLKSISAGDMDGQKYDLSSANDNSAGLLNYEPKFVSSKFVDVGGGVLGLQVVQSQDAYRKGTACFFANGLEAKQKHASTEGAPDDINRAVKRAIGIAMDGISTLWSSGH